jgi:hypothetical protein
MEKVEYYLLFAGDMFYPGGGTADFIGTYFSLEFALEAAARERCDWWEIAKFDPEDGGLKKLHSGVKD